MKYHLLHDTFDFSKVLWTQTLTPYFKLFVALAILEEEKDHMVANNYGFNEILKVSIVLGYCIASQFCDYQQLYIIVCYLGCPGRDIHTLL